MANGSSDKDSLSKSSGELTRASKQPQSLALTGISRDNSREDVPAPEPAKKNPPPKPPVPAVLTSNHQENKSEVSSELIVPNSEEPKKPDWLEELSRKQAHRKSGFFRDQPAGDRGGESKLKENEAPKAAVVSPIVSPTVPESKPVIPTKPSQIRDEGEHR